MRIVVTGGAGFVGANLSRRLAERDHEVLVLDDLSTGFRSNLEGSAARLTVGSILDTDALDAVVRGADAVVHLAARGSVPRSVADPATTNEVNVTGTMRVLLAAREAGAHVIVASSSSVYGANPVIPKHEDLLPRPMSPYAVSKLATETYALAFAHVYDLPVLPFRFFNIYGPMQSAGHVYAAVVPAFVSALLAGRPLPVHGDGKQSRDFTSVHTVVDTLVHAVEHRVTHDAPVNLAFGTQVTLLELIAALERLTGSGAEIDWHPARVGDVRASSADSATFTGLFPTIAAQPFEAGLQDTIDWFERTGGRQW